MARKLYGASPADYFISADGSPVPGAVANVYNARTGGSQVTQLQNLSGTDVTQITSDSFGGFAFYGPDGTATALWVQAPGGTTRYKVEPVDVADRVAAIEDLGALESTATAETRADATLDSANAHTDESIATRVETSTGTRIEHGTSLPSPSSLPPGTIFIVTPL